MGSRAHLDGVYTGQNPCYCSVSSNDQQPQVGQAPKQLEGLLQGPPLGSSTTCTHVVMFAAEEKKRKRVEQPQEFAPEGMAQHWSTLGIDKDQQGLGAGTQEVIGVRAETLPEQGHATALQAQSGLLVMPQVADIKMLNIHSCVQVVDRSQTHTLQIPATSCLVLLNEELRETPEAARVADLE
ncbi:MAG: hypothetical protein FRX49_07670 [Trebouxia sp. A1-2]|nr:MAG: hypothetical protein FRX49_07670 [Trebouxia sp. A1-2]